MVTWDYCTYLNFSNTKIDTSEPNLFFRFFIVKWAIETEFQQEDLRSKVRAKVLQTCVLEAVRTQSQGQWSCPDKGSLHMYWVHSAPISQSWSVFCFQWSCWLTGVLLPCVIHTNVKDKLSSVNHCLRTLRVKRGICGFEIVFLYGNRESRLAISTCHCNSIGKICIVKVVVRGYLYQKKF